MLRHRQQERTEQQVALNRDLLERDDERGVREVLELEVGIELTAVIRPSPGLGIAVPELAPPKADAGTKIRVPGVGVIGEIPKMDFGLELLYGASQNKLPDNNDRNDANGVMLRSKIPLGSSR